MTATIPHTRAALRQRLHAMIGNMFFGPVEAVPLGHSATKLKFRIVETGKEVSFDRSDLGESVFVEYFVPARLSPGSSRLNLA